MYPILSLNFEKSRALTPLCIISYKSQNLQVYLIFHMMTSVAWKQSYRRFSEQLDFFELENSVKFLLLKLFVMLENMLQRYLSFISPFTNGIYRLVSPEKGVPKSISNLSKIEETLLVGFSKCLLF